jgi:calcium/calmodulin-dependent protein kinase kinase 2
MADRKRSPSTTSLQSVRHTDSAFLEVSHDGRKKVNQYEFIRTLGKGAFGKVKLATDTEQGRQVAIKMFSNVTLKKKRLGLPLPYNNVLREIAILKKLDHDNIVKLYEVIDDPKAEKLYMVFEYVGGGSIMKGTVENDPLPLSEALRCFRQLCDAVMYLHEQGIVHRDIKPENILRAEDGTLKLSDFGVSHICEEGQTKLTKSDGTPAFMAPETSAVEEFDGFPVDLWAMGITLYQLVYGKLPFIGNHHAEMQEAIQNHEIPFPWEIPPPLKDLISGLLEKNPEKRLKLPDVVNHPWMVGEEPLVTHIVSKTIEVSSQEIAHATTSRAPYNLDDAGSTTSLSDAMLVEDPSVS